MRKDAIGMFWEDIPKSQEKREPPNPYWDAQGYLPDNYDDIVMQSLWLHGKKLNDIQLANLANSDKKQKLFFDIETYPNYFCVNFKHSESGGIISIESTTCSTNDILKLKWIFRSFIVVGFNCLSFDCPIATLIINALPAEDIKRAADMLIVGGLRKEEVLKYFNVSDFKYDAIDLIEVAPLKASLKIYGGRLHTPSMQDLPFKPDTVLTNEQMLVVNVYCFNDIEQTILLAECLSEQMKLRDELTAQYQIDLRSKSDAQIAEAVITKELRALQGKRLQRPLVEPGRVYMYQPPHFLTFKSDLMRHVFKTICNAPFRVAAHGGIEMPKEISDLNIKINNTTYTIGIGGLHSCEKSVAHVTEKGIRLRDRDVASYYPFIILLCGLFPSHLGRDFLTVYKEIVDRRIAAKRRGDKAIADSLKIVINGSFGKLGSQYSILYAPNLMIQVTVTGQLSLLMLIERLELAGIEVVSANTDGVVIKSRSDQDSTVDDIVKQWEIDTGFETEETEYLALYSRDVNNYVAIKKKFDKEKNTYVDLPDGFKGKGAFADPWADKKNLAMVLHKNPSNQICINAAVHHITTGGGIEDYLRACADITQFVSVRTVKGGAYKEGYGFLGKSIRWYYAEGESAPIIYAASGNKVPKTDGAKPIMSFEGVEGIPPDLDYSWYVRETEAMLSDLGFTTPLISTQTGF